ncbi:hypothetical protein R3P38DRAFT_2849861 [Favolaschia claudopus]|uniref:F-box domain-containing protein n=1 Tax=Favolaschia claudopus TaxID=2862362 RepID=A0AAW0DY85_9AGAR
MSTRLPRRAALAAHMDTPYRDILYTNIVPDEEVAQGIHQLVVAPMQEIQGLSIDIDALQARIDQLTHQQNDLIHLREGLTEFVESHLALVSIPRTLPHDILREIFIASLPSDRYPTLHRNDVPLIFLSVCLDWRRVALSVPRLWTSLHIVGPAYSIWTEPDAMRKELKAWLPRSTSLPLTISFVWTSSSGSVMGGDRKQASSDMLRTLMEYSDRWEHMRFVLPSTHFEPLTELSAKDVPILRTIAIYAHDPTTTPPSPLGTLTFISGTQLEGISVKNHITSSALQSLVPFGHIRQLHFAQFTLSLVDILNLLGTSPQLETCAFRIYDMAPPSTPMQLISMVFLHRLSIADENRSDPTRLFGFVDLPNLEALEYSSDNNAGAVPVLNQISAHKLVKIGLSVPISSEAVKQHLALLPNIQSLVLRQSFGSMHRSGGVVTACNLFSLLTTTARSALMCPHLQHISCLGVDGGTYDELLILVNSRNNSRNPQISPLSDIHIFSAREPGAHVAPQLAAAGCNAVLRHEKVEAVAKKVQPAGYHRGDVPRKQGDHAEDWGPFSSGRWMVEYAGWGCRRRLSDSYTLEFDYVPPKSLSNW